MNMNPLTIGKKKIFVRGLVSLYRLNNGWYAKRRAPESGWRDRAYWTLYLNRDAMENNRAFSGGVGTLENALASAKYALEEAK